MAVTLSDLSESGRDAIAAIFACEGHVNGVVTAQFTPFTSSPSSVHNKPPAGAVATTIRKASAGARSTQPVRAGQSPAKAPPSQPHQSRPPRKSTGKDVMRADLACSVAVQVESQVAAYKKSTEDWSSFFHEMASQNMSGAERAGFETVRGMVQSIERLLKSEPSLRIPRTIRLAVQHDLDARRAVSAAYLSRSAGAHRDSPLAEGNRRHAFFQQAIADIRDIIARYNLPVGE